MDRTLADSTRVEEKALSELVYTKLGMLTNLQVPTTDFNSIYSKDMFIRPNSRAFIYVMHFLFTLYDLNEFKKRFFWPTVDKKSESNFRSSALEYLVFLKIKYNCNWNYLNRSLLVMPGGYKFLLFLNDFLEFVAKELIKQSEKYLPKNVILKNLNCTHEIMILEVRAKILKTNAVVYAECLDAQTRKYEKATENLYNIFKKISNDTKIPINNILKPSFIDNLKKLVNEQFQNKIKKKSDSICNFEKYVDLIQENFKLNENEKCPLEYDINILCSGEDLARDLVETSLVKCNDANLASLMDKFVYVLPKLNNIFSITEKDSIEVLEFQNHELQKLNSTISKTNSEATELSSFVQTGIEEHLNTKQTPNQQKLSNDFRPKYIETPPMIQNFNRIGITRLPLMEESLGMNCTTLANCTTINPPRSVTKSAKSISKKDNNSKTFDPSHLLRSLSKNKKSDKKKINQSNRNESMDNDCDTLNTMLDSNTCRKVNQSKKRSQFKPDTKKKLFHEKLINTSPAFQKVQNTRQIEILSTSPTGRLEPLVKLGDISEILWNSSEKTIRENYPLSNHIIDETFENSSNSSENKIIVPKILVEAIDSKADSLGFKESINEIVVEENQNDEITKIYKKNETVESTKSLHSAQNSNKTNKLKLSSNENFDLDGIALVCNKLTINDEEQAYDVFNMSDSVLNDIEM